MVIKVMQIIAYPIIAFIIGIFFLGLARKIMARIQRRYGPPITQPVIDLIRFFNQKGISHGNIFNFGIVLSLAGSIVVLLFIPFGNMYTLSTSGGLLVIIYLMLLAPLGIALSGGEGANPNISIGISRKMILSLGYEVPFLLIILSVMTYYKTISLTDIIRIQQEGRWALFSFPLFLPGLAYLLILPAILGMRPFDIASAPQEIASGTMVEYGGKYLALVHIEHAFTLFIGIALFVNLFLGGANNIGFFFLKMIILFIIVLIVNAVFPRYRAEQAVKYLWKWPTIIALVGLILTKIPGLL